jgi:hypothetical protein
MNRRLGVALIAFVIWTAITSSGGTSPQVETRASSTL